MLQQLEIRDFETASGTPLKVRLTYRIFGPPPGAAPVVLVTHALTGNSEVSGEYGWWKALVGPGKCIDTANFTVISIDVPGNGTCDQEESFYDHYEDYTVGDVAVLFLRLFKKLRIEKLFAAIGGSIGGALVWELAALQPGLIENLIPIATDYKATDWVLAQCEVQKQILNNSSQPVHDARMHAMTFYRTPQSFEKKFRRQKSAENGFFEIHNWLNHHGKKLENRFELRSYKLMNHLLTTIDISHGKGEHLEVAQKIGSNIHIVAVDSDLFFLAEENKKAFEELRNLRKKVSYHEINSIHGHDAFLIEYQQLENILAPIFNQENRSK